MFILVLRQERTFNRVNRVLSAKFTRIRACFACGETDSERIYSDLPIGYEIQKCTVDFASTLRGSVSPRFNRWLTHLPTKSVGVSDPMIAKSGARLAKKIRSLRTRDKLPHQVANNDKPPPDEEFPFYPSQGPRHQACSISLGTKFFVAITNVTMARRSFIRRCST